MSNSSLVSYTKLSPHHSGRRNHEIDTITPHVVVGQLEIETIGEVFNGDREVSSNYGIGKDGRIGLFVEEKNRSWCSSSSSNDNRAITIECASDLKEPYAINDKVYASLVKLCVDICKRNGIKKLKWAADKRLIGNVNLQNITVHRWFANKSCPGEYLYSRLGQIADEVNAILDGNIKVEETKPATKTVEEIAREVISGKWGVGQARQEMLTKAGYRYEAVQAEVNRILQSAPKPTTSTPKKKTVDEIAKEVIQGRWGFGQDRKRRLTEAGYNYSEVQLRVNQLL